MTLMFNTGTLSTDAKPFPADRCTIKRVSYNTYDLHTHYAVSGQYDVSRREDGTFFVLAWHGRNGWVNAGLKVAARVLATLALAFPADFAPLPPDADDVEAPRGTTDMRDDAQHRTAEALVMDLEGFRGMLQVYRDHGASPADVAPMARHAAVWRAELAGRAAVRVVADVEARNAARSPVMVIQGHRTLRDAHRAYTDARRALASVQKGFKRHMHGPYGKGVVLAYRDMVRRAAVLRARFYVATRAMARRYGAEA